MVLETDIESEFASWVELEGGIAHKLHGRGWPDRLVITHTGKIVFLEMKRPDGNRRKYQIYIHKILKRLGQDVRTAYTIEEAKEQYNEICSS